MAATTAPPCPSTPAPLRDEKKERRSQTTGGTRNQPAFTTTTAEESALHRLFCQQTRPVLLLPGFSSRLHRLCLTVVRGEFRVLARVGAHVLVQLLHRGRAHRLGERGHLVRQAAACGGGEGAQTRAMCVKVGLSTDGERLTGRRARRAGGRGKRSLRIAGGPIAQVGRCGGTEGVAAEPRVASFNSIGATHPAGSAAPAPPPRAR